jgi:Holliday junction resolvase RusA-like endonuclease
LDPDTPISFTGSELVLALTGKPVALQRARFVGHFWNPSKKESESFRTIVKQAMREYTIEKPAFQKTTKLELQLTFHLTHTASKSPDIDNLCKFVMDACNGLLYHDDIQIFKLTASKIPKKGKTNSGKTHLVLKKLQD